MNTFGKIVAGLFFGIFFLLFLLLGTIKFEVLNSQFIFSSFERNGVYEKIPSELARSLPNDPNLPKEEKEDYAKIVSSVSPKLIKKTFEENLLQIFNYLNGNSKDVNIFLPGSQLGLEGVGDINWSFQNLPKESLEKFQIAHGMGNRLILVWFILLTVLVLLFLAAGRTVLIVCGVFTLFLGGIGRLFLLVISSSSPSNPEPSQVLLKLLSTSLLVDIAYTWIGVGIILMVLWKVLGIKTKNKEALV